MKSSNRYAQQFKASRDGAKAEFDQRQVLKDLQALSKRIQDAQANLREEQKSGEWRVASQDALSLSVLYKRLHDLLVEVAQSTNMSRPGAKAKFNDIEDKKRPIEAYGVKGMKSTPWRKTFKDLDAMNKWVEANDAEVYGTRDADNGKYDRPGEADAFALGAASEATRPEQDEALTALAAKVGREHTVSLFKRWSEGKASMSRKSEQV